MNVVKSADGATPQPKWEDLTADVVYYLFKTFDFSKLDLLNCRAVCRKWKEIIDQIGIGKKALKRVELPLRAGETWLKAYHRSPKIYLVIDTSGSMNKTEGIGRSRLAFAKERLRELAIKSLQISLRTISIYSFDSELMKWEAANMEDVDKIIDGFPSSCYKSNLSLAIYDIVRLHLRGNDSTFVHVISDCDLERDECRDSFATLKKAGNLAPWKIFFHNVTKNSDFINGLKKNPPVRNRGLKRKIGVYTNEKDSDRYMK